MDKGHHEEDSQLRERQDMYLTQKLPAVGRSLVAEDKLVEVEGRVTAGGRGDTHSDRRGQAGNLLGRRRGNLPELEDSWDTGDHCRQEAEELRDSQNRTFSFSLRLQLFCIFVSADISCPLLIVTQALSVVY